jgi:hypothetical protein
VGQCLEVGTGFSERTVDRRHELLGAGQVAFARALLELAAYLRKAHDPEGRAVRLQRVSDPSDVGGVGISCRGAQLGELRRVLPEERRDQLGQELRVVTRALAERGQRGVVKPVV